MDNPAVNTRKSVRCQFRILWRIKPICLAGAILVGLAVTTGPAFAQSASDWGNWFRCALFLPCDQAGRLALIARLETRRDALIELRQLIQSAIDAAGDPNPSMFDEQAILDKLQGAENDVQNQLIYTQRLLSLCSRNSLECKEDTGWTDDYAIRILIPLRKADIPEYGKLEEAQKRRVDARASFAGKFNDKNLDLMDTALAAEGVRELRARLRQSPDPMTRETLGRQIVDMASAKSCANVPGSDHYANGKLKLPECIGTAQGTIAAENNVLTATGDLRRAAVNARVQRWLIVPNRVRCSEDPSNWGCVPPATIEMYRRDSLLAVGVTF